MALLSSLISCINQRASLLTPRQSPRAQPTILVRPPPTNSDSQDGPNAPHQMFDRMPDRHFYASPSSTSLILAHTKRGDFSRAFELFTKMSRSGGTPDEFALGSLLKASSGLSDVSLGEQLHAKSIRAGLASEPGVRTSLIAMYFSNDLLEEARQVFDEVPLDREADVPTWNSILSAYAFHGCYMECFLLFAAMLELAQLNPTGATYAIMINACTSRKEVGMGKALHAMIVKDQILNKIKMHNSLISMYSKCGFLEDAKKVFKAMDRTNVVSWNAMISGLEQNGECENSIKLFRRLARFEGRVPVRPNRITFLSVLNAISTASAFKLGGEVHSTVIRSGLELETSIGNSIITMYGKCGEVAKGRLVFERLNSRDVITWNSMLAGCAQNDQFESCCALFREMQSQGNKPDIHTLIILLGGLPLDLSVATSCRFGMEIHAYILRRAISKELLPSAYNAVIAMYAKSDRLGDAEKVFKGMDEQDIYTWNAMMDGYSTNGYFDDALTFFIDMHEQGLQPNHSTLSLLLAACSGLASIELGKQLHAFTIKHCLHHCISQPSLLSIRNALVSMYSKCGSISDAEKVFKRITRKDVFSWTSMITGYAHHGMASESLQHFRRMTRDGVRPNSVTFLGLLSACAHAGLVKEGMHYFALMRKESDKKPSIEHYACMVDLFGRAGKFKTAQAIIWDAISHLTSQHNSSLCLWKVLLGTCHAHKQLDLGVHVAAKILELEPDDETTYVLLSNLYASFGLWEDAIRVRSTMRERGLKKEAGCSWVEVENKRHVFVAGDGCHPNRKAIYKELEELDEKCRDIGYVPMTECVLHDVDEAQKELILGCHSEKLAVSFLVLQTRARKGVIRVMKNLRVCGDCHNWMKFASKVTDRQIVLRDSRRFHTFKDGKCSCGDYW